ncbi:slipin family protein [Paenibacillus xanthanilyticus]|uniref:Slipin family protein n=1 Tax=Paenibacillus xanthanilyticus TaxID=1783531 RepID=A0ABV8K445_9BACL
MFNKQALKPDERGLVLRRGHYIKMVKSGVVRYSKWRGEQLVVVKATDAFQVEGYSLESFLHDSELAQELEVIEVRDHELVLHYENEQFKAVLRPGRYAFWKGMREHRFVRADIRQPALTGEIDRAIVSKLGVHVQVQDVASHERGFLFYDNLLQRELAPGRYYFWRGPVQTVVRTVDMRQQQMDLTGQEMMTEDKITLRLNFVCQYRIVDPTRLLDIKGFEEQLHIELQLVLRQYVGTLKLDDLLRTKQEVAAFVLARLNEKSGEYGLRFLSAGVKDIILPGEIKDILNTVLLAEKKAQANLITRREETASTRSLLNTAKLMDENRTLYRLKELEFLEKICEKIGTISLSGGSNLPERLDALLGSRMGEADSR